MLLNDRVANIKLVDSESVSIEKFTIKPGDFINLSSWFNDVWAEVTSVTGDPINAKDEYWSLDFCHYSKGGLTRWHNHINKSFHGTVRVVVQEEVDFSLSLLQSKRTGVVHTVDTYYGGFGQFRVWPSKFPKKYIHSSRAEHYREVKAA